MFKYLWIFTFIIPYTIWTFFSIKEIYKWRQAKILDVPDNTIVWFLITISLLIVLSIASFMSFLG